MATCALALVVCHTALALAAPISSCCPARSGASAVSATEEKDCCPAGSHPPGQCPLHKGAKASSQRTRDAASCRIQCDSSHGAQFVIGTVGVLPAPALTLAPPFVSRAIAVAAADPVSRPFLPDLPPPRLS